MTLSISRLGLALAGHDETSRWDKPRSTLYWRCQRRFGSYRTYELFCLRYGVAPACGIIAALRRKA